MVEVLATGWLLVALPMVLMGKITRRPALLLPALVLIWLIFGFTLAGPMVLTTTWFYVFVALQSAFFGALFLRYDLLSTLSAAFTVEVCLMAFPLLFVFRYVEPMFFLIPVAMWALLLIVSAGLYARPQFAPILTAPAPPI